MKKPRNSVDKPYQREQEMDGNLGKLVFNVIYIDSTTQWMWYTKPENSFYIFFPHFPT